MKIIDIRKFVSADRKCHVALTTGTSKDGFVSLAKFDGKTFVLVKGDKGRPSRVSPTLIESITWHSKSPAGRSVQSTYTCGTCKETFEVGVQHSEEDCSNILSAKKPVKPLRKVSGKSDCGCTASLKCKQHAEAAGWIKGGKSGAPTVAGVTLMLDSLSPDDIEKVIAACVRRLRKA